jgi:hypothetical protein
MPMVTINLSEMERFEAGTLLLSHLYYPRIELDAVARDLHFRSVCHAHLRYRAQHDPAWASQKQFIDPRLAFVDEKAFKKGVRQSMRRERDRRVAAKIGIGLMAEAMTGKPPSFPKPIVRLSLAELAEFFLSESHESEPLNVIKRAWADSKPVIHVATALEVYWRAAEDGGRPGFHADLHSVDGALEEVLALANAHQAAILRTPAFKIGPDRLIEFKLVA